MQALLTWARRPEILGHPILPAADVPHLRARSPFLSLGSLSTGEEPMRKRRSMSGRAQNKEA